MRTLKPALAALLACAAAALAQPLAPPTPAAKPPAKKTDLEKALEEALKSHPDIRTAEAKLALAQAELTRARLEVAQKVVAANAALRVARAMLEEATRRLDALKKTGRAASRDEVAIAEVTVLRYQAEAEAAEATLKSLRGGAAPAGAALWRGAAFSPDGKWLATLDGKAVRYWDARTGKEIQRLLWSTAAKPDTVGTSMAERIRKAMDGKMKLDQVVKADEVMGRLQELSGLKIKALGGPAFGKALVFNFGEVPLGAVFQFVEDSTEGARHVFVVREYGLLFVPEDKVPPGAVTLMGFWKGPAKAAEPKKADTKKDAVEGRVISVDKGLLQLSIGSDEGVARGDVMELFRLGTAPKYLGRVRIVEASPKQSVGETVGKLSGPVKAGDIVARSILRGS